MFNLFCRHIPAGLAGVQAVASLDCFAEARFHQRVRTLLVGFCFLPL